MAVNPYFTFADPALQQAVVQEAQVQAALQAAQAQQRAATIAALRQERQQRAIREGDIRRLDAAEAERRRQFDVNTGLTEKDIASREKIAGARGRELDDRELYGSLLKLVEGDDPPTIKELEARMVGLSDERKQTLRDRRNSTAAAKKLQFTQSVNEANRLRGLIGLEKDGKKLTADDVLRGSQWKNVLQVTPDGLGFESLLRPPREDAPPETPTFHVPIRRPPAGTEIPVEGIGDVLGRTSGAPGSFRRGAEEVGDLLLGDALRRMGRGSADVLGREASGIAGALTPFRVPPMPTPGLDLLAPTQYPFEGRIPLRVPARPTAEQMGFEPRYAVPMGPPPFFVPEY